MSLVVFLIFLAACIVAGASGAVFPPGKWYDSLEKPDWTPANWMFPVVWTTLYFLMAWAAVLVANTELDGLLPQVGLALWALQIALNALWTPVFFGLRRLAGGMLVLVLLWFAVLATTLTFLWINFLAGLLFVPYLIWVSIAGALNYRVWRLNPEAEPLDLSAV